jgi:hypothetical protein
MSFDFPASPIENQEYAPRPGVTYVYKAPRWVVQPIAMGGGAYLPITGGTVGPADFPLHLTAGPTQSAAVDYDNTVRKWYSGVVPAGYYVVGDITGLKDYLVIDAVTNKAVIQHCDVTIGARYLRFLGDTTGEISAAGGGPLIFGDTNYLAFKTGPGNGGFFWTDASGVNVITYSHLAGGAFSVLYGEAYKPGGGPWVAPSSRDLKRDVVEYRSGLSEILQLNPIVYSYNGKGGLPTDARYAGLLAEEVEPVMPEMVGSMKLADLDVPTINTGPLIYALVNAVKELSAKITALEAQRPA